MQNVLLLLEGDGHIGEMLHLALVNLEAQAEDGAPLAVGGEQKHRVSEGLDEGRVEPALAEHVDLLLQLVADELRAQVLRVESVQRLNGKVHGEEHVLFLQLRGGAE
jgi:hypothetical protein